MEWGVIPNIPAATARDKGDTMMGIPDPLDNANRTYALSLKEIV